jgi:hypothetical protein
MDSRRTLLLLFPDYDLHYCQLGAFILVLVAEALSRDLMTKPRFDAEPSAPAKPSTAPPPPLVTEMWTRGLCRNFSTKSKAEIFDGCCTGFSWGAVSFVRENQHVML